MDESQLQVGSLWISPEPRTGCICSPGVTQQSQGAHENHGTGGPPFSLLLASLEGPLSLHCLCHGGGPLLGSRELECGLLYQGLWVRRNWSVSLLCTWLIKTTTRGLLGFFSFLAGLVELISEFEAASASLGSQVQCSQSLEQTRRLTSSPTSTGTLPTCKL